MRFEWNDQKAVENLNKHGVSFGEATEVFYDPNALEALTRGTHSKKRGLPSSACRVDDCYMSFTPSALTI